jgi:hypothetical protein
MSQINYEKLGAMLGMSSDDAKAIWVELMARLYPATDSNMTNNPNGQENDEGEPYKRSSSTVRKELMTKMEKMGD